jgi:hypothetical protein
MIVRVTKQAKLYALHIYGTTSRIIVPNPLEHLLTWVLRNYSFCRVVITTTTTTIIIIIIIIGSSTRTHVGL